MLKSETYFYYFCESMKPIKTDIIVKNILRKLSSLLYIHKYGIMGTVAFHLILAISFVSFKINNIHHQPEANIVVEFPEELIREKEKPKEEKKEEKQPEKTKSTKNEIDKLLKSIAVNEDAKHSGKKAPEENVEDYIKQLQQELEQKNANLFKNTNTQNYIRDSIRHSKEKARQKIDSLQKTFYQGKSSVSYNLKGRYKTHLPIPVFKCENSGYVVVIIYVNRYGRVTDAKIDENKSKSKDELLWKTAIEAAKRSRFNDKPDAPEIQQGTISYNFVKQ